MGWGAGIESYIFKRFFYSNIWIGMNRSIPVHRPLDCGGGGQVRPWVLPIVAALSC